MIASINKNEKEDKLAGIELFGKKFKMLEYSLNIRSKMHDVISSNIANINTPGYKCKKVDFEKELDRVLNKKNIINLETTNKRHFKIKPEKLDGYEVEVENCNTNVIGNDNNNVDLDKEMAKMSENHLLYNIDSQILGKEFKILKNVISQGGR